MTYNSKGLCHSKMELKLMIYLMINNKFYYIKYIKYILVIVGIDDSGEVANSEWSGWQFDPCCEIFSLLNGRD